jgi:outer membrane murein-binding lipoprotein Lpp
VLISGCKSGAHINQFAAAVQQISDDKLLLTVSDAFRQPAAAIRVCHTQTNVLSADGLQFVCDMQL